MNLIKFLDTLSDKESLGAKGSRRDSFKQFKDIGKNAAMVSIPFAMAATSKTTKAATNSMASAAFQASPTEVLEFALALEYLEREFYQMGLASGVIDANDETVFQTISDHEDAHVAFLLDALGLSEGDMMPEFDFTGAPGGLNLDPFNNYETFMALAQGFEDTGVRAYKGQAGALANDNTLLDYALQIHSVEARHASQVRRMRGSKGWITQNNQNLGAPFAGIYAGEQNTTQGGAQLAGQFGPFGGDDALTEAFDEPLTMQEVLDIAGTFIVT
jgi:rubrerythrin